MFPFGHPLWRGVFDGLIIPVSRTSVDTGVALQAQLEALYANSSVLTTTDPFNLLGFARKSGLNMRERRDLVWFTQRGFMPARSSGLRPDTGRFGSIHESRFDFEEENEYRLRPDQTGNSWLRVNLDGVPFDTAGKGGKDEHGFVYESIQAGAWEVRWDDTDVLAIVAQVSGPQPRNMLIAVPCRLWYCHAVASDLALVICI